MVDNEPEVARSFTWAVLGMEDDNFWHLGGVTRWKFNTYMNFSRHRFYCFIVVPLFVLDKSMAWNIRCLQHPCFKNLCKITRASKNSDPNAQHFLSNLLTHSWFHSMLFALPCYQLPYTVKNRCLYLSGRNALVGTWEPRSNHTWETTAWNPPTSIKNINDFFPNMRCN